MKLSIFTLFMCFACSGFCQTQLTDQEVLHIKKEIESIGEKDQRYRSIIALGTFDPIVLKTDKAMRDTASITSYLKFLKGVEKTITKEEIDSLWGLQHYLDKENYISFKSLVSRFGYPSSERLDEESDNLYAVLLHPPHDINIKEYQKEIMEILLPEVKKSNIEALHLASFYDNMQVKILQEPQLYGTNKSFDPATMSVGKPQIANLKETNLARLELGLPVLQDSEYVLIEN